MLTYKGVQMVSEPPMELLREACASQMLNSIEVFGSENKASGRIFEPTPWERRHAGTLTLQCDRGMI